MKCDLIRSIDGEIIRTFPDEHAAQQYVAGSFVYRDPEYTLREHAPKTPAPSAPKVREEEDSHERMSRIKASLKEIDNSEDIEVTTWEANFLETCIRGYTAGRYLSERQIDVAEKLIDKYLG